MAKKRSPGDGGLYYNPSKGLWVAVIDIGFKPDGRRNQKYVYAKKQSDCRAKLEKLKAEVAVHGAPISRKLTTEQWALKWLDDYAMRETDPKSFAATKSGITKWMIGTIGRHRLADLKPTHVKEVLDAMADKGLAPASINRTHSVMTRCLADALTEQLIGSNPALLVRKARMEKNQKSIILRNSLPSDQAVDILIAATKLPNSIGSRWWFKFLTGQRQGEILGAEIGYYDPENAKYTVDWKLEELVNRHGCPEAQPCGQKFPRNCPDKEWRVPDNFEKRQLYGRFHLTHPKSQAGREVPLLQALNAYMSQHIEETAHWPNPHGLIWRNQDGTVITDKQDAQEWRELLVAAGVIKEHEAVPSGTRITGHWARHTTVTLLAFMGVDAQTIAEIVGHSSREVTEIYRHIQPEEKQRAMEKLGTLFKDALLIEQ